MADVAKWVQERLAHDPDAVQCGGCTLLYAPERYDGTLIVNVVRFEDDPPGSPGIPLCNECLVAVQQTGHCRRDSLVAFTGSPVNPSSVTQPPDLIDEAFLRVLDAAEQVGRSPESKEN